MADIVTARAKPQAAEAFELLEKDLEKAIKEGTSTTPFPEKYRVMFEGIPCWPKLPNLFKPLKANGVNVTAVVYAPAFGFVYNGLDEMARAYYKAPNSVCIEQGVDWREGICRDNKVDGVLVHYNRSCKPWSGYMPRCNAALPRIWVCPAPVSTATRPIPGTLTRPSMRPVSRVWSRPWRPIKLRRRALRNEHRGFSERVCGDFRASLPDPLPVQEGR